MAGFLSVVLQFFMFQKIKDFFNKSQPNINDSKSLQDLMAKVGYNRELIQELSQTGEFNINLAKKITSPILEDKRLLLIQNDKEAWRAFQIANAQNINNICFINFFPKNLKGLFLKTHKNKKNILYLKSLEETKDLQECLFVSNGDFNLNNIEKVGDIESEQKYLFLFNSNLSEISKVEKALTSNNIIGFSSSTSIFDGSRFGFSKIFSQRKNRIRPRKIFTEDEIKLAISLGKLNFYHFQSVFDGFDNNKLLAFIKHVPGMNVNIAQAQEVCKNMKSIINSMTPKEKQNPMLLSLNSRIERIAKGCGQPVAKTKPFISQILNLIQITRNPQMRQKFLEGTDLMSLLNPSLWPKK